MMFSFSSGGKNGEFPGGVYNLFDAQEIRREASSNSAELLLGWNVNQLLAFSGGSD